MADEKTFLFEILTLQKLYLQEQVRFVIAPGQEGQFEILANHAPFVFALKPGPLRIRKPDGSEQYLAIGGGFLVVQKERTVVLTRSAERPEEIDVERATRAKEEPNNACGNRARRSTMRVPKLPCNAQLRD